MPRIEPIPFEDLSEESRRIIDDRFGEGLYATQVPLQVFAYRTSQLAGVHDARTAWGTETLLGGRILELIRIRSAQLGECQPCMQSRKHESITDEDVACLLAPGREDLDPQEAIDEVYEVYQFNLCPSFRDDFHKKLKLTGKQQFLE